MFTRLLQFLEDNHLEFNFQISFNFGLASSKPEPEYEVVEAVSPSIGFHNFIQTTVEEESEDDDTEE